MTFEYPSAHQLPELLGLWKRIFGDYDGFWELFLEYGFSADRCRCIVENGQITASLCWFDCQCGEQKQAYVYAVLTHPDHRGRGLCPRLLADTHACLQKEGYTAVLLVPAGEGLREMYRKLGYRDATTLSEFSCGAGETALPIRAIGPEEYAALRREFLPGNSVVQEKENLRFLSQQAQFYTGEGFLLAAYTDGDTLHGMELLGDASAAPGIVKALECKKGHFRTPGTETPFAMIYPLQEDAVVPEYFGFAFD